MIYLLYFIYNDLKQSMRVLRIANPLLTLLTSLYQVGIYEEIGVFRKRLKEWK